MKYIISTTIQNISVQEFDSNEEEAVKKAVEKFHSLMENPNIENLTIEVIGLSEQGENNLILGIVAFPKKEPNTAIAYHRSYFGLPSTETPYWKTLIQEKPKFQATHFFGTKEESDAFDPFSFWKQDKDHI